MVMYGNPFLIIFLMILLSYCRKDAHTLFSQINGLFITPILKSLPVPFRIEYKVSLLTHQCLHGNAPIYLKELITPQPTSRHLRSGKPPADPKDQTPNHGRRSFLSRRSLSLEGSP
ncbi:unnamed protein product [Boreogadus saida]